MVPISEMKSPGVFIDEVDLSAYVAVMDTSKIFGIVTVAQSGPIGVVTDVKSVHEFEEIFGNPISSGGLACRYLLAETSSVKVVRAASSSAEARSVTLQGKDEESESVASAVIISYKYKGTIFSDSLKATVSAVSGGSADKFNLKITKGTADQVILNKNYTIVKSSATDDFPYLIEDTSTNFVFSLGGSTPLASLTPVENSVFSTGNNGTELTESDIKSAVDAFDDPENVDLDILAAPGMYDGVTVGRLLTVAQSRKDCVAVIDTPPGLTPDQVVEFVNGESQTHQITKLDTTYAAGYYPWGYVFNDYSGVTELHPASVGVLAALAHEYTNYNQWTAPAGEPRMDITVFSSLERVLTRVDRDKVYAEGNLNPLCNYKGLGLTAFGQKTFQRKKTATDRLNVRFLVNYVKRMADYASVAFLFTEINENTFDSWTQEMDKVIKNIKDRGGLYDYKIEMSWRTVTDEMLNNNIMPGVIQLKPNKSAEFIPVDVAIYNRSDDFV